MFNDKDNKYFSIFSDYQIDNEANSRFLSDIIEKKRGLFKYFISDVDLQKFMNLDSNDCPKWHKMKFEAELKKRCEYKEFIVSMFRCLSSPEDLSFIFDIPYHEIENIINRKHNYKTFFIPKKTRGVRIINKPLGDLKIIQSRLSEILYEIHHSKYVSHGFEFNKNNTTNAEKHIQKRYVINIDLKDFFPSIKYKKIQDLLKNDFNFNKRITRVLAQICCYNKCLPQGSPASPVISNMICKNLDSSLHKIAFLNKFTYTRYADDLSFSTNVEKIPSDFINEVINIINKEGFQINNEKFRIQNNKYRQIVTGLCVNKKVNVRRKYIRNIKAILHCWQTKDLIIAKSTYFLKYDKLRPKPYTKKQFLKSLRGRIEYIGTVRGKNDYIYLNFLNRFNTLIHISYEKSKVKNKIENTESCTHNPKNVAKFLNLFVSPHENDLKRLVYENKIINLQSIIKNIENDFFTYNGPNKIPKYLWTHIKKDLIDLYKVEGLKIWVNTNKNHPMKDLGFSEKVITFKKSIKTGSNNIEETNLIKLFTSLFETINYNGQYFLDKYREVVFLPSNKKFSVNSNILTDVISFKKALKVLLESTLQHSNGKGKLLIESQQNISKLNDEITTILNITDVGSKIQNTIHEFTAGSSFKYCSNLLWSLCDWEVIGSFPDEKTYNIPILPNDGKYKVLNEYKYNGFTHRFTFYQVFD